LRKCKPKNCRVCKNTFQPMNSLQYACSPKCALTATREKEALRVARELKRSEKAAKRALKARRDSLKSKREWLNDLQRIVNRYVRLRDSQDGCISCDKPSSWAGQWHCSHFYTVGSSSYVRFNLWNMNKSCSVCNNFESGAIERYAPRLIDKIGLERYEWLERNHSNIASYDIEWIKRAIKVAKRGVKRLENRQ